VHLLGESSTLQRFSEPKARSPPRANKCGGGNPRIGQDEGRDRIVRLGKCLEADVGHIDATENQAMSGATEFEIASTSPLTSCYTGVRSMVH
jgi:hypothetical protein